MAQKDKEKKPIPASTLHGTVLNCRPISQLKHFHKECILGNGAFGKVYLMKITQNSKGKWNHSKTDNGSHGSNNVSENMSISGNVQEEKEYAAKVQAFHADPLSHRREACIMKRLAKKHVRSFDFV